jgi:hypothetical protein
VTRLPHYGTHPGIGFEHSPCVLFHATWSASLRSHVALTGATQTHLCPLQEISPAALDEDLGGRDLAPDRDGEAIDVDAFGPCALLDLA